jgi:hypothetical protein
LGSTAKVALAGNAAMLIWLLRSLTLAQWIEELKRLNSHHQRIMAG